MAWEDFLKTWAENFVEDDIIVMAGALGLFKAAMDVISMAGQIEAQGTINHLYSMQPDAPISPQILADMVERNIVGQDWAAEHASWSGISNDLFDLMVKDTGEPPGIMEMLSLLRRGDLSESTFDQMVAYSRIRTEWTDQVKRLQYVTMSAADAINAVVKGVIDSDTGQTYFEHAGGMADQYQTLLDASGDAIGVEQVLNLWLHGYATSDDVKAVILHSRINPTFEPLAAQLWHKYMPAFQVERILKAGGCTPEQASTWMSQLGYSADQVAAFVAAGSGTAIVKAKEVTEAQILDLYEAQFITQQDATTLLTDLGYPATAINYILEVTDAKKALAQLNKARTAVQKAYIAGQLDEADARSELAQLEVPLEAVGQYITDWNIERKLAFKTLTMAEVGGAYKKGFITDADALARWSAMGYNSTDSGILLAIYGGPPPVGSPVASQGG